MKNIVFALILLCILSSPALAHHSFAMYDQTKTLTLTGKLTRFVLGANHAQLLFELLGPDGKPQLDANGKPVVWGVETGSAKQLAGAGITVETFPYELRSDDTHRRKAHRLRDDLPRRRLQ